MCQYKQPCMLPQSVWLPVTCFCFNSCQCTNQKESICQCCGISLCIRGMFLVFRWKKCSVCKRHSQRERERDGERESGKSVSGGVFACVYLCVFLAGCVLGFHHTRTLPPGALSLSLLLALSLFLCLSLWFCENTLRIRWAAAERRKRRGEVWVGGWGSDWRLKGRRGAQACCGRGERGDCTHRQGGSALSCCHPHPL